MTSSSLKASRSKAGFDLTPPSPEQLPRWSSDLDDEERRVILDHGTERPFCGVFNEAKGQGSYGCRLCGLPLFRSGDQIRVRHRAGRASSIPSTGTTWPSCGTRATAWCGRRSAAPAARAHLGHVFDDGPPPTGERYCMNSVSLRFVAEGDPAAGRFWSGERPKGGRLSRQGASS